MGWVGGGGAQLACSLLSFQTGMFLTNRGRQPSDGVGGTRRFRQAASGEEEDEEKKAEAKAESFAVQLVAAASRN